MHLSYKASYMNKIFEIFVTVLTAISVIVMLIDYSYSLTTEQRLTIWIFDSAVVGILVLDFWMRMKSSAEGSAKFILRHWYEIPAMLPVFLFDIIGTSTLLGAGVRSIRLIRLFRLVQLFFRAMVIFRDNKFLYLIMISAGTIITGSLGEYIVESPIKDAKITSIGDAFWWAMATVTTVGYGDVYPVTVEGRIIASIVMIIGIAILGIFISTLGASLIESRLKGKKRAKPSFAKEVKEMIKDKIDQLENLDSDDFKALIAVMRSVNNAGQA